MPFRPFPPPGGLPVSLNAGLTGYCDGRSQNRASTCGSYGNVSRRPSNSPFRHRRLGPLSLQPQYGWHFLRVQRPRLDGLHRSHERVARVDLDRLHRSCASRCGEGHAGRRLLARQGAIRHLRKGTCRRARRSRLFVDQPRSRDGTRHDQSIPPRERAQAAAAQRDALGGRQRAQPRSREVGPHLALRLGRLQSLGPREAHGLQAAPGS
jgi:hypothetical protein